MKEGTTERPVGQQLSELFIRCSYETITQVRKVKLRKSLIDGRARIQLHTKQSPYTATYGTCDKRPSRPAEILTIIGDYTSGVEKSGLESDYGSNLDCFLLLMCNFGWGTEIL